MQILSISNNFIYLYQLGRLKHKSTTDIGITLTHFIRSGWVKNLTTNILAFDIAQFFSSLNYQLVIRQECGQTLDRVRIRTDIGQ